jgi:4-amino-4-deoxy-L-arabinose transferase-like glycosyltransferase
MRSVPRCPSTGRRATLAALFAAAAFSFLAGAATEPLKGIDDCRYARKGLEAWHSGSFFEVTWGGRPDFDYPPLQFWVLGRSFALLGESDLAARLPSILMALAVLAATYRAGRSVFGRGAAVCAVAVLAVTPIFATHARRCMMDVPLCFWTTLALLVFLAGLRRPRLHALMALPIGAAILTKGPLGLLPFVLVPAALATREGRGALRSGWLWLGLAGGLLLGASWPVREAMVHGRSFVEEHFVRTMLSPVMGTRGDLGPAKSYAVLLLERYQPVVLPALAGLVVYALDRRRRTVGDRGILLAAWLVLPLALYSLSTWRSDKYLIPLLPAMALFAGYLLDTRARRFGAAFAAYVAPAVLAATGFVYWFAPELISGQGNMMYKEYAPTARAALLPGTVLPYAGEAGGRYNDRVQTVMWYWDADLAEPTDPAAAVTAALAAGHGALVCSRERLAALDSLGVSYATAVMGKWGLVWLARPGPAASAGAPAERALSTDTSP